MFRENTVTNIPVETSNFGDVTKTAQLIKRHDSKIGVEVHKTNPGGSTVQMQTPERGNEDAKLAG